MSKIIVARQVPQVLERRSGLTFTSVEAALAHFHLNWGVTKRPLFARIPQGLDPTTGQQTGIMKRADNLYGVVRDDTLATLGAVSGRYNAIGNAEALAPFGQLCEQGSFPIKLAGQSDGGASVWMQASVGEIRIAEHFIDCGITARFRHDGGGSLYYGAGFVRRSCFNSLQVLRHAIASFSAHFNKAFKFRHTASANERIRAIDFQLRAIQEAKAAFITTAEELLGVTYTRSQMEALVKELLGARPSLQDEASRREQTNWDTKFYAIMETAWGAVDLADVRFTAWGALNAVADYEQHLVPVKGTPQARQETLMARSLEDGALMRRATEIVLARR